MADALVAFDVEGPGMLTNRRDFAMLPAGNYGDGMAVDSDGRLYVSSRDGVQVFDKTGKHLGVIPTPRGIISVAFAGPKQENTLRGGKRRGRRERRCRFVKARSILPRRFTSCR